MLEIEKTRLHNSTVSKYSIEGIFLPVFKQVCLNSSYQIVRYVLQPLRSSKYPVNSR